MPAPPNRHAARRAARPDGSRAGVAKVTVAQGVRASGPLHAGRQGPGEGASETRPLLVRNETRRYYQRRGWLGSPWAGPRGTTRQRMGYTYRSQF